MTYNEERLQYWLDRAELHTANGDNVAVIDECEFWAGVYAGYVAAEHVQHEEDNERARAAQSERDTAEAAARDMLFSENISINAKLNGE